MSFVYGIGSWVAGFFSSSSNPVQPQEPTRDLAEIFKEELSTFRASSFEMPDNVKECIRDCIKPVVDVLDVRDCDLSAPSQKLVEEKLEMFRRAVDETPGLTSDEVKALNDAFIQALCTFVEDKWAVLMAESFHPIPLVSDEEEKIIAAHKWACQFFKGASCFQKWRWEFPFVTGDFFATLQNKTLNAFHAYSHKVIQSRMEAMCAQAEKDPVAFKANADRATAKAQEESSSLSEREKKYVQFADNLASCVTLYWPGINKNMELLKKCIWHGYTLQTLPIPLDPPRSQELLASIFEPDSS